MPGLNEDNHHCLCGKITARSSKADGFCDKCHVMWYKHAPYFYRKFDSGCRLYKLDAKRKESQEKEQREKEKRAYEDETLRKENEYWGFGSTRQERKRRAKKQVSLSQSRLFLY